MTGFESFWSQGDAITRSVAALLLLMSVSAWVVILWKGWLLRRVRFDVERAVPAFWAAPSLDVGREQLAAFDREQALRPLLAAAVARPPGGTLEAEGRADSQLTRRLRDALHGVLGQLQFGQVLLASIGATAPFVGLFGTTFGIINAFSGMAMTGSGGIAAISAGIAEALITTALGLVVAIVAVWAYNYFAGQVDGFTVEMDNSGSELLDFVKKSA